MNQLHWQNNNDHRLAPVMPRTSGEKAVLYPASKLVTGASLAALDTWNSPLHHHALEEIATERTVCLSKAMVKRESSRVCIRAKTWRQHYGAARDRTR